MYKINKFLTFHHFLSIFCHFLQKKFQKLQFFVKKQSKMVIFNPFFVIFAKKCKKQSKIAQKSAFFRNFLHFFEKKCQKVSFLGIFYKFFTVLPARFFFEKNVKGTPFKTQKMAKNRAGYTVKKSCLCKTQISI